MKNVRKALALVLSVLFICSAFSLVAAAEECNHNYTATYVAPTCVDSGYTLYVCYSCGDNYKDYKNAAAALGHNYGAWKTLQTETCVDEGFYQRDCSRCGASEVKTVSVIEHYDSNYDNKCDTCGIVIDTDTKVSPFDWLIALFEFIRQWFSDIFA